MLLKLVVLVLVDLTGNLGLVHIGHLLPKLVGLLILGLLFTLDLPLSWALRKVQHFNIDVFAWLKFLPEVF